MLIIICLFVIVSLFCDIISLQIVFNYFTLMRRSHWKILKSKQSSNQFLMLQKNCLKFSFYILIHWYMYIISSFVFLSYNSSSYFLFEIHQIFLYFHSYTNFPASFSASIHTYDLSLKITVFSNLFSCIIFWK